MSNDHSRKGRPPAVLGLPPPDAWPGPEALLSRAEVAELFGVTVPTFRGWERRAKGPPLAFAHGQEPRYRCSEAREWLEREVRRQEAFERVYRLLSELAEEPEEEPEEQPIEAEPKPVDPTPVFVEPDDELFDPFATARRSVPRRPSGYFS